MASSPQQYVTLVVEGGVPVRLADQFGAPYPTTGHGALVFSDDATLTRTTLIDPIISGAIFPADQAQATNYALDTGLAANSYVAAFDPVITAASPGMPLRILALHTNTGPSTFDAGYGPLPIVRRDGSALIGNEILASQPFEVLAASNHFTLLYAAPSTDAVTLAGTDTQSFVTPQLLHARAVTLDAGGNASIPGTLTVGSSAVVNGNLNVGGTFTVASLALTTLSITDTIVGTAGGTIAIEERGFITGNADGSTDYRMRRLIVQGNGANNITKLYDGYYGVQSKGTAGVVSEVFVHHSFVWPMASQSFVVADAYYGHFLSRRENAGDPAANAVNGEGTVFRAGNSSFLPQFTGDEPGGWTVINGLKVEAIGSQIAGKVGSAYGVRIEDTDADATVYGLLIETTTGGHASNPKKSIVVNGGAFPTLAAPNYFGVRTDMQLKVAGSVTYPLVLQNLGTNAGSGVGIQFDVIANATPPIRAAYIHAVNDSGGSGSLFSLHFGTVNGTTPADNLILNYVGTANIVNALAIGSTTPPNAALVVTGSIVTSGGGLVATDTIGVAAAGATAPYTWGITFSGDAGGTTDVRGPVSTITASGASNIAAVAALTGNTLLNQTSTVAVAYGGIDAVTYTNSGPVTLAKGHDSRVVLDTGSSGVIALAYGSYARVMKSAGTGTYTNVSAFFADDSGGAHVTGNAFGYDSASMASAGTLTANFRAQNTSAATRWAFLASGSAPSGLLGGLRVGSVVQPVATLDITGTFAATKAYGAAAAGNNLPNQFVTTLSGDAGGTTDARNLTSTITYSGAVSAANISNLNATVNLSHTAGTVTTATLISASMNNSSTGIVGTMRGADIRVTTVTSSGTITEGTGVYARVSRPSGTGTFTTARAFYADDSGGAQVTGDAIGYESVAMQSAGGNTANFRAANASATNRFAYLSTGTALSQLAGPLKLVAQYLEMNEMTAPAAPAADTVRFFSQDNGAGKTQLMAIFSSGAAVQVAIQP